MQKKYNYHDLKKDWKKPLPDDVNAFLGSFAKALKSEQLEKRILKIQEKKLFGKLRVYDAQGIELLMTDFKWGIAKYAELNDLDGFVPKMPLLILFNRSLKNDNVTFEMGGPNATK